MPQSIHTPAYAALKRELRACRESAGLSQRELAAHLKVPHSWVAKVESGERRIDLIEFCWFMNGCGCNTEEIFARINFRIGARRTVIGGRR